MAYNIHAMYQVCACDIVTARLKNINLIFVINLFAAGGKFEDMVLMGLQMENILLQCRSKCSRVSFIFHFSSNSIDQWFQSRNFAKKLKNFKNLLSKTYSFLELRS